MAFGSAEAQPGALSVGPVTLRLPAGGRMILRLSAIQPWSQVRYVPKRADPEGAAWIWSGPPLAALAAMLTSGPGWSGLRVSAGAYSYGIPRGEIGASGAILAILLDGRPIPATHGGPVRLVGSGIPGLVSVRGVSRVSACWFPRVSTSAALCAARLFTRFACRAAGLRAPS